MLTTADNSVDSHSRNDFKRLLAAVPHDKFQRHSLVDTPDGADIILFVGSNFEDHRDVRAHPYLRQYKEKCFLYHSHDFVIPFLPGVYVNITKRWHSVNRTRAGFYMRVFDEEFIAHSPGGANCEFLFCFIGSSQTHPVRSRVVALSHPRAYIEDTSAVVSAEEKRKLFFMVNYGSTDNTRYGSILSRSKFVICPRGYACSSWRLFETMKAGRVPVIISDQWVPPEGPQWETFSIRIPQKNVSQIPEILERHESRAEVMGQAARTAWEEWFSREACFHRIVEWCLDIQRANGRSVISDLAPHIQLLRPYFFRHVILPKIKKRTLSPFRA
jgi:hypothetical protein